MQQDLEHTVALLGRTPATLNALLRDLPDVWTLAREEDGTWTPREIILHLVHGERTDWMPRLKRILEAGETQAFDPVDRIASVKENDMQKTGELLDEFARLRARNLEDLCGLGLTSEDMRRRGKHPAFGIVSMSQLLATWAAHDLTHLHQITRILAHQYREAVGPWQAYLGVLHCNGHSAQA